MARGRPAREAARKAWDKRLAALPADKRGEFERRMRGELPGALADAVRGVKEKLAAEPKDIATRVASEIALEMLTAGGAGDGRRLGRPDRLQQHAHQGA